MTNDVVVAQADRDFAALCSKRTNVAPAPGARP